MTYWETSSLSEKKSNTGVNFNCRSFWTKWWFKSKEPSFKEGLVMYLAITRWSFS